MDPLIFLYIFICKKDPLMVTLCLSCITFLSKCKQQLPSFYFFFQNFSSVWILFPPHRVDLVTLQTLGMQWQFLSGFCDLMTFTFHF